MPDALRVQVRTSGEEGALIADTVADKLLAAKGIGGFSSRLRDGHP